ncbi:MAG: PDZ domain-containing protein [Planctomycetaceae bacterium]|mgnify:CR=1 FL=1|nr:PDZ domain-containing protein [Planctomycetaceae bacterium]
MFLSRLSRTVVVWGALAFLAAGVALGQTPDAERKSAKDNPSIVEIPGMPGPEGHGIYPPPTFPTPPTFLTPPGGHTGGAIIMQPPIPPGQMPPMIWPFGEGPQEVVKPSDHWIGVQCGQMSPALRTQLGLEEDQGVLVEALVDDSPATKAGIERHDVLIQAGDRKLTKVQDLIDEVDAVKDGKLSVELVRKGEKKKVELTPVKRPPVEVPGDKSAEGPGEEWQKFFDYMQQWEPGKDGRPSMKFQFWRQPGTIMPSPPKPEAKLPGNVKIKVLRQGEKPAEIEVTRGDESWSINEGELDKLPADLRPHVERMLGRHHGPGDSWNWFPKDFKVPNPLEGREGMIEKKFEELSRRIDQLPNPLEGREGVIERRFEEMNRRLDQLRDSIEQLRGKRREKAEEEPSAEPKPEKKPEPKKEEAKLKPAGPEA